MSSAWGKVGGWLKDNAGEGAALVGSLLTGNVMGAVAAGTALVQSATGKTNPDEVLERLQTDPVTLLKLKELVYQNEADIRRHLEKIHLAELEDAQAEHQTTQETIRAGDQAESRMVRWTRPGQSWLSLLGALAYIFMTKQPDVTIAGLLLTLPWAYAGLREVGKGYRAHADVKIAQTVKVPK